MILSKFEIDTILNNGEGLHTMRLDDHDQDGDLDIITVQIHAANPNVYLFENDGSSSNWIRHDLMEGDSDGTHNGWSGVLNQDGMPDIYGKHYTGENLDIWYNSLKKAS